MIFQLKSDGEQKYSAIGIHFLMVGLLVLFMGVGSVMFMIVEGSHQNEQCCQAKRLRHIAANALIETAAKHSFGSEPLIFHFLAQTFTK